MTAVSDARIQANRQNASRSTGPKTAEGKAQSRRNGLKHGLSGSGVVVADQDASETELRTNALMDELNPRSTLGKVLVGQLATLSVRMERGSKQEEAAIAGRVRHAREVFDHDRIDLAEQLFKTLAEAPRQRLIELRRSPEGVDRLLVAWGELLETLTGEMPTSWGSPEFQSLANLMGLKPDDPRGSTLKALAQATSGHFDGLHEPQGDGHDSDNLKTWARGQLIERIEAEIEALKSHRETLDLEAIELDRIDSEDIALFDPSREAALARRYEAEARRGFFKALKEFRQVEAEAELEAAETSEADERLASSWVGPSPTLREPKPGPGEFPGRSFEASEGFARGLDGRAVAVGRSG